MPPQIKQKIAVWRAIYIYKIIFFIAGYTHAQNYAWILQLLLVGRILCRCTGK